MTKTYEGNLVGTALKVAVVVSKFNAFITDSLQSAAVGTLISHGVDEADIAIVKVPGAFELPVVAGNLAESGKFDAVVTLGCVIRGATTHYDYVCSEAAKGVAKAAYETGVPVIFGVLTTESIEQAIERAGTKAGNKGADAALAAIEMANLLKRLQVEQLIPS